VNNLDNKAITAPKLNVMTIDKVLGHFDGLAIVSAHKFLQANKVAVESDGIGPIFYHRPHPTRDGERTALPANAA
jgi:hypothetical protein